MSNTSSTNLLIALDQLPSNGLKIKDFISLDNLNNRMNESPNNDIIFTKNPEIDLEIKEQSAGANGQVININGQIKFSYQQACGLCLENQAIENTKNIKLVLKRRSEQYSESEDDDLGLIYFDQAQIDLEDIIQEEIILNLSPYLLPERDSKGNCLVCGKNEIIKIKEQSAGKITLGDLIQKSLSEPTKTKNRGK